MAGNAQIPHLATEVDREHGYDPQGRRLEAVLYRHIPHGHRRPMFWVVQFFRVADSPAAAIDRSTRVTSQISCRTAETRALREFADVREVLLETRKVAS